jgi:23S rRNA (cytidine1920-2'-O)/16S rRNA (cytidine1409-2'-O)-methyltransferase
MDLSFISVTKVLPALRESFIMKHKSSLPVQDLRLDIVVLVKPQFEVGKGEVGKGGIVRDEGKRIKALENVKQFAGQVGFHIIGDMPSPLAGAKGNQEFLLYLQVLEGLKSLS